MIIFANTNVDIIYVPATRAREICDATLGGGLNNTGSWLVNVSSLPLRSVTVHRVASLHEGDQLFLIGVDNNCVDMGLRVYIPYLRVH